MRRWRRDARGFPAGQAWVDLAKRREQQTGVLWALRVHPLLQGLGVGTLLIHEAERLLRERGYREAELGVEWQNIRARQLYERLGYRAAGSVREEYGFTPPNSTERVLAVADQLLMRKPLRRKRKR